MKSPIRTGRCIVTTLMFSQHSLYWASFIMVCIAARTFDSVCFGRAAKEFSVPSEKIGDNGGDIDSKAASFASSARKMTSSPIRVAACGEERFEELAMP